MSNAMSSHASRDAKSPKAAAIPYAVADISTLAKSLRASLDGVEKLPGQVQMLNWLAKAAGYQNYQSLVAKSVSLRARSNSVDAVGSLSDIAVVAKLARPKAPNIELDIELSAHAAKALTQFDIDGKLMRWPHKFTVQRIAMWGLWIRFDSKRKYSEKDVNSVLNAWHLFGDHATLRRELVNMDLLARKADCSVYWKQPQQPSDEIQAFLRSLRKLSSA